MRHCERVGVSHERSQLKVNVSGMKVVVSYGEGMQRWWWVSA